MRLGNPSRMAGASRKLPPAITRGRTWLLMALVLVSLVSFSCRRPVAPAPPPEPAAPPPPPPAPTISLTANPATIDAGNSTTLTWTSQNANMVTIEPGIGGVAANGMQQVTPNATVTYTARAAGPGGSADDEVTIMVNAPPPPPPPPPPPAPDPTVEELFLQNMQPVYFDFDQSEIRPDQIPTLTTAVNFLQQNPDVDFTISGHADERGTQEYNIGLGDRRANSVRQFFLDRGIAADRIMVISFGEERPVCTAQNEACWAQNRRDEFEMR